MKRNTVIERLSEKALENKIEQAFEGLWSLGVLGVKVVVNDRHMKVSTYLLSNAEIEDVTPAMSAVTFGLKERFIIEEAVIHGVVPWSRISAEIAA
jgi:hypothetical protein